MVSCGHRASHNLLPALRFTPASLLAACDLVRERRDLARCAFGAELAHENREALLDAERDFDAVIVCCPPDLHRAAGLAALRRGLPVLLGEPPGVTLEQAGEIETAVASACDPCRVGFRKRHARNHRRACARLGAPDLGRITHILLRYSQRVEADTRSRLAVMGTRALGLVRHFAWEPDVVNGLQRSWENPATSTCSWVSLGGVTGHLVLNVAAAAVLEWLELTGEGASLHADALASCTCYPREAKTRQPPVGEAHTSNFALQTFDNSSGEIQGYVGEIAAFVRPRARAPPTPDGAATIAHGVAAMRLAYRILAAS